MTVAALVTGVAWYHYTYMREDGQWETDSSSLQTHIDWLITVPLQVVEFSPNPRRYWRRNLRHVQGTSWHPSVMLVAGFFGESGAMDSVMIYPLRSGGVIGMAGWGYLLYELWSGDVKAASETGSPSVQYAFNSMRLIVTVGWAIYPIGYLMGAGTIDGMGTDDMNILYNIADLVNKGAFGMMIWYVKME